MDHGVTCEPFAKLLTRLGLGAKPVQRFRGLLGVVFDSE
jgi:hypothetical protein